MPDGPASGRQPRASGEPDRGAQEETLRLHQANEQTMLAWIRTGVALMAFGFAIARFGVFLHQVAKAGHVEIDGEHGVSATWMGAALVGIGVMVNVIATVRYGQIRAAIERGKLGAPGAKLVYVIGATAALAGIAMTLLLAGVFGD